MLNEDSLERELSCGVCFELYDVPLQLPCMHTFCKSCLKDIIACSKNKKLKCPDCRKNVDLGKTGIDSLKRNFKLASIVEIYRQASEKLTAESQVRNKPAPVPVSVPEVRKERAPSPVEEKDYEFLTNIIQRSQEDANSPFEPHIIDDLWGTFRRTTRKGSQVSARPPAPPPPRLRSVGKSNSGRPLPPLPRPGSRNLSNRPLPESPDAAASLRVHLPKTPSAPMDHISPEPSAPPYPDYRDLNSLHQEIDAFQPDDDDLFDMTSLNEPSSTASSLPTPPVPPRRLLQVNSVQETSTMANRPPIPVPRRSAPSLPHKKGKTMDSIVHRPPPPLPRGNHS